MISLKLAKRELLNNSRYWLIFTLNLSLGLLGFVLIFLFRESIGISLEQRAKTLLSSDIAISGRRELVDLEQKTIDRYLMDKVSSHTDLVEMYSMGMAEKASGAVSRLTFIKAIQGVFPLIGEIRLKDGRELTQQIIKSLQAKPVVIISSEVSHQFKLEQGDFIQLGKTKFNVLGILAKDTTSAMRGVSFAPKVYIGLKQLAATGLTGHGSIAWFTDFYLLNKNIDHKSTLDDLKKMVKDPAISVRGPKDSGQQLGRVLNYLTDYLGLVGLVAVLISSIGAFYLFQSYLLSRIKYMGILKTLGLSKQTIAMSFIWIIIFLGMLASSLSLFLVKLFLPIVFSVLTQWMDISYQVVLTYSMLFTLFSISILINAFVCVPLIISVLKKPTIELLQNNLKIKFGLVDLIYYVPAFLFLWSLAIWQAHSVKIGSIFIFAIVGIFIVVFSLFPFGFNYISNKLLKLELKQPFSLSFGLALRYFIRNKVASMLSVLCLAIGILLMTVIAQISASLEVELTDNRLAKPSLFLFDIQDDQSVALVDFAKKNDIPLMQTTPMVRARLIKKMGKKVERLNQEDGFVTREESTRKRFNNRGVNISYNSGMNLAEKIVEGKVFTGIYTGEGSAEISLEKRYAKRLGVSVGDTLTYDILGVEVKGIIVNLRQVKWTSFLPNFFIVMQPGVLEEAPKTFLSSIEDVPFKRQLDIQNKIVEKFPNVSIINVKEIITKMLGIFKAMSWAINLMSLCCLFVGLFVLFSILQSQILSKQKTFALQKIMGMGERLTFKVLFLEFIIMITCAVFLGNSLGILLSYFVSRVVLDGGFILNWGHLVLINSSIFVLGFCVLVIAYRRNYNKKINELLLN